MTHEDAGHYALKHPPDTNLNPGIAEAVKHIIKNGKISCAAAHKIARELKVPPADVGVTIDLLEARINRCQLGLYGYEPEKRIVKPADGVPKDLEETIKGSLADDRLPCKASWEIAEKFGISRMNVSAACETLNVKISVCQLGSFK
ncbi:MAG: hypothetical protein JXC33_12015 [Deltaproteobacteria bacterium]|nr:hypothetical protein [Deltaproteobacteria bacterium]